MPECATNGRFCPHDLRLSILQNHWDSQDAMKNPFLAHWLRDDRNTSTADPGIPMTTRNRRPLYGCNAITTVLIEGVERDHFDEPKVAVSLDGHPSPGEQ